MLPRIQVRSLKEQELKELDQLFRSAKSARVRNRAQMILLSVERSMAATEISLIVRCGEETVRRWIKRFNAEGVEALFDAPRSGAKAKATLAYRSRLLEIVRQRPRSLKAPFSLWTLRRLADFMAEETGIRLSAEGVRLLLKKGDIVLSRPQHKISSPDPEYMVKKRRLKTKGTT